MKLDLSKQTFFVNALYVALMLTVFCGGWFVAADVAVEYSKIGMPLGSAIDNTFADSPIGSIVVSSLLVLLNLFLVTRLCFKNVAFLEQSYMPAFIYVVICAGYLNTFSSIRPLIALTVILYAIGRIFSSYDIKSLAAGLYLNIGFYFGLAAVIYEPAICLIPLVIIALMIFRFFDIREWVSAVVGAALPLFFAGYINWLIGGEFIGFYQRYIDVILTTNHLIAWQSITIVEWVFLAIVTILVLLSIIKMMTQHTVHQAKATKSYLLFVWFMLISIAMLVFIPCRTLDMLLIVAAPISVIIPVFFRGSKPVFIINLIFLTLIISVIALHVVPMFSNVF